MTEFRKLMAFGNSSYVVSVPKAWVEKNRLKKGDVLVVEERPNELIFASKDSEERRKFREAAISAVNKGEQELKTEVTSLYINNFDIITVTDVGHAAREVKGIFHSLVGMEIVEETTTKVVAKDLLDVQEVSMSNIVRRVDIILRSMLEDSKAFSGSEAESVYERDKEVNRLTLLGFRTARAAADNPRLLRLFGTTYWNIMVSKQILSHLERLGDQLKRLLRFAKEKEKGTELNRFKEFKGLFADIARHYESVMKIYYNRDKSQAFKTETNSKNLLKECDRLLEKYNSVAAARMIEYFKYMIISVSGILRNSMEQEEQ
ncbi:phosphate uptake regulator PhoU [Candidatus Woesearchaeota archaeon]|nr:phosphate uptake regulator PhoU [Candidatus Woesearchaeota archaeon]